MQWILLYRKPVKITIRNRSRRLWMQFFKRGCDENKMQCFLHRINDVINISIFYRYLRLRTVIPTWPYAFDRIKTVFIESMQVSLGARRKQKLIHFATVPPTRWFRYIYIFFDRLIFFCMLKIILSKQRSILGQYAVAVCLFSSLRYSTREIVKYPSTCYETSP